MERPDPPTAAGAADALRQLTASGPSLASDNHSDNAADYDNCQIQALDFYNLNIPQRQDKPGYDQAGEAHSSVGYGQCAAVACGGVTFCPTRGPLAMRLLVFMVRGV